MILCNEMDKYNLQILGIFETNWNEYEDLIKRKTRQVLYSGKGKGTYSHDTVSALIITYSLVNGSSKKAYEWTKQVKDDDEKAHNCSILN